MMNTVSQCDLPPLRPHCGEVWAKIRTRDGRSTPLDHHTSLICESLSIAGTRSAPQTGSGSSQKRTALAPPTLHHVSYFREVRQGFSWRDAPDTDLLDIRPDKIWLL